MMAAYAYEAYWAATNRASDLGDAVDTLRELIDRGFLIENDADELSEIMSTHAEARGNREQLDLVIAPSMACNLDCFYCFETNRYAGRMNEEVQTNIVRLVRGAFDSGTKRLSVTWYGGEPLLAFSVIERLSKRFLALCEESGREYSAEIVTNGTMLTHEKARRLAAWKVKRAQITLDGAPQLHDARRVPKNRSPTFYRILEAIEVAAVYMHISVRINVCRKVAEHLEELLQILAARGLNKVVSVYVAPLQKVPDRKPAPQRGAQDFASAAAAEESGERLDPLDGRAAAELQLRFRDLLWKYGFPVSPRLPPPCQTTCMADKEHGWLIEANGNVQKCYWTAGLGAEAVGHLTAEGVIPRSPYRKWQDWTASRDRGCMQCVMLPICLGRCPLKHLTRETDYCPAFKHNWLGFMARAAGVAEQELVSVQLPLAGVQIRDRTAKSLMRVCRDSPTSTC